ncbi:SMI1/KNR4 family protein [Streptomyces sp. NPDC051452]|uniref:SMI1/KNR4 family protein n=1 Tax=Streptomyces sp. NPDC051452 TaxID=3365654 RepID=UPI00379ADFBA
MSAHDKRVMQVERHFGVRFPQDYRDFLGGTGSLRQFVAPADDFLVIDALDELIGINEAGEFQKRFPGAVVIGGSALLEHFPRTGWKWDDTDPSPF